MVSWELKLVLSEKVSFAIIKWGVSREGVVRELLTGANSTTLNITYIK